MKLIVQFEIAGPIRLHPKLENFPTMKRLIWLWFSIAVYPHCGINDLKSVFADAWRHHEFEIDEDLIDRLRITDAERQS